MSDVVDPRVVTAMLRADFYLFIREIFPLVSPNTPLMTCCQPLPRQLLPIVTALKKYF
jgi:hypothetical protein